MMCVTETWMAGKYISNRAGKMNNYLNAINIGARMDCSQLQVLFWCVSQMAGSDRYSLTQHIATVLAHYLHQPRPNDRNISTQNIASLLGATCCARLATLLRRAAACCKLKIELVRMPRRNIVVRTWPNYYNIMQHLQLLRHKCDLFKFEPITPNISQHIAVCHSRVAKRSNVAIV